MTWVCLMFSNRIIKLSLIAQIDLTTCTNMKRVIWNVDLEMFTVPELDWFSDGRWQTDVKWCGSDIKVGKISWMQETDRRKRLIIKCYRKEGIHQCFPDQKLTERKETDSSLKKPRTHLPFSLYTTTHNNETHSERPDSQQAPTEISGAPPIYSS